ncbi:hypothetical protein Bca101_056713 [Brassica carinata]
MDIDFGLEDVLYITGLPTDGEQVSGYESQDIKGTIVKQLKIDEEKAESLMMNSGSSINLSRLKSAFEAVPHVEDIGLEPYFKAYLLFCWENSSFSPMYLPLLGLDVVNNYAWGAAMLANLKESLRKVKDTGKFTSLCGFSYALTKKMWAITLYPPPSGFPLILGWMEALCKPNKDTKNVKPVEYYQKKLQNMKESGVVWQPYKNRDLILSEEYASQLPMVFSRTPCTCFNECAYNRPDVCFKQLGKEKSHVKTSLPKMMKVKRKNLSKHKDKDWKCVNNFYKFAAEEWKKRYERFICEIARDEVTNSEPEQQEPQGVEAELQEQWEQQFLAWKLDPRVSKLVESTCFRWVLKIENGVYRQAINLLSALVSMYDESRNHFVIGNPKMDIDFGLEDVLYITGLPTDGEQVSGYESQDIKGTIVKQLKIDEEKG